ncbi:helix-turn-helix domain-containing protein [Paracrocinitomix mangrovi]|uniref:helix-turn-helix transcriptional regulator n=1 Tax=Paracrocinitomix mangrovi TaxID=2862509 RepID=UPI001C8F186A|nr:helix-turn-helix transcriptional regulator [Paracrocinitomix mangrovi]UKN01915.1 helix-turn-helix domain-containing protein [Paracrocinitomix mangrovi]
MDKTIIAKNFKKLRLFKSMNQSEFADLFGITRSSVGSYEEGRAEPKLDTLLKVADYFKLKVDDIIRKELTVNQIAGFNYPTNEGIRNEQLFTRIRDLTKRIDSLDATIHELIDQKNRGDESKSR